MPRRPGPRHDRDAGGPAELLGRKAALREEVWAALSQARVARFPGADGRIPNFTGAEAAAERLRGTDAWREAATLKANTSSPTRRSRRSRCSGNSGRKAANDGSQPFRCRV